MINGERIAKVLARAGIGSRRQIERLIEEEKVMLNGTLICSPAINITVNDEVRVNGTKVRILPEQTRLWRYYKPVGLLTTHDDPHGRPTVFGRLPDFLPRVISVGRLDINSEGLLLLTNDGALSRLLEHPSSNLERTYRVRAHGRVTQADLDVLSAGTTIDGVKYGSIIACLEQTFIESDIAKSQPSNSWISMTLCEGKNREIRKVLDSIGLSVNKLKRIRYGPLQLGHLRPSDISEVPSADVLRITESLNRNTRSTNRTP